MILIDSDLFLTDSDLLLTDSDLFLCLYILMTDLTATSYLNYCTSGAKTYSCCSAVRAARSGIVPVSWF